MPAFETPTPIELIAELIVGDIRIAASDRRDTVVEVRPRDSERRDDVKAAEQTRVEYSAGRLLVKSTRRLRSFSPFSDGGGIDVQIELPAGSRVRGHASIGGLRSTGPLGDTRFKTSLGDLHVEEAATVALETSIGDIQVDRATVDAELSTSTGTVRAGELGGAAVIKNSNGATRVGDVAGDLRVKAANGDIAVGRLDGSLKATTANGDIDVGTVSQGSVELDTGRGAVSVAVAEGTAAWLDLNTGYGHLNNALETGGPPGPGDPTVEVRARSGYGDISVRRAAAHPTTERRQP
jgi:Putative adhesin